VSAARAKRILVVEDEALIAMMLEDMLIDLGFDVVGPALTFENALRLARSEDYDCAILDVNLGSHRSYPIADAVAARGLKLLFASGYDSPAGEWTGAAGTIRKPFDKHALATVLRGIFPRC
jgi:DNA-binding response OmpR family regulator